MYKYVTTNPTVMYNCIAPIKKKSLLFFPSMKYQNSEMAKSPCF